MHTSIHVIWTEATYLPYMCHSTCSCPPENISIHCSSKSKLKCLSRNAEKMFLSGCTNTQLKLIVIPIVTSNVSFKNKWIFNSINQDNNFREVWSTVSVELHHQFPWSPFTSFVKAEKQTYLTLPAALTFPKLYAWYLSVWRQISLFGTYFVLLLGFLGSHIVFSVILVRPPDYFLSAHVPAYKSKIIFFTCYETVSGTAAWLVTAENRKYTVRHLETLPHRVYVGDMLFLL